MTKTAKQGPALVLQDARAAIQPRDAVVAVGGRRVSSPEQDGSSPLVSVITVVFNEAQQVRDTIKSVLALREQAIEYIVVDGGSTDGTVDVLKSYGDQIDFWISEPDAGIYDAMNKGIRLACGDFVLHLNIGDKLLCIPAALSGALPPGTAGVAACVRIGKYGLHMPSTGLALNLHNTLHHQGCFYRRKLGLRYDTRYRVFADFDLNQRLLKSGQGFVLSDEIVAAHDQGGISHNARYFHEVFEIVRINQGPFWLAASYLYFKLLGLRSRLRIT